MFSNIMDNASQSVASAKVKRGDGKSGNANRDKDQIEEEDGHWMILWVHRRPPEERQEFLIADAFYEEFCRNLPANRLRRRQKIHLTNKHSGLSR